MSFLVSVLVFTFTGYLHDVTDAILSDDSLAPYSVEELQQLLDLVTNIADAERFDHMDGCIMSVVGKCSLSDTMPMMYKGLRRATHANIQYVFALPSSTQ
jgi:hypothetical protein